MEFKQVISFIGLCVLVYAFYQMLQIVLGNDE
jgi:hypothetical protein